MNVMKKVILRFIFMGVLGISIFSLFSCSSMKNAAMGSVATMLSGADKKNVAPKKGGGNSAITAITGERDVTLVSDFFPTALVLYEILYKQNPNHLGLAVMTGQLNVMYANAFVQSPADELDITEFDKQQEEYSRASMHYLRGRDYCLEALEGRHKGIKEALFSGEKDKITAAVSKLDSNDVSAAYWCSAGWLAAFSLDPLNPDMLDYLSAPVAVLEKAAEINPDYSGGAIWDVLFNFYVSAPEMVGGDYERGIYCHEQAMRVSGGKTPGPYVTYAQAVCVNQGDREGFIEYLNKALEINPDDDPDSRLMTIISQKKAKKLLSKVDDYFLEW